MLSFYAALYQPPSALLAASRRTPSCTTKASVQPLTCFDAAGCISTSPSGHPNATFRHLSSIHHKKLQTNTHSYAQRINALLPKYVTLPIHSLQRVARTPVGELLPKTQGHMRNLLCHQCCQEPAKSCPNAFTKVP